MIKTDLYKYLQKAITLINQKKFNDAKKIYNQILAEIPSLPDAYYGLFLVEWNLNNEKKAKEYLKEAIFSILPSIYVKKHKEIFEKWYTQYKTLFKEELFFHIEMKDESLFETLYKKKAYKKILNNLNSLKTLKDLEYAFYSLKEIGEIEKTSLIALNLLYFSKDEKILRDVGEFFKTIGKLFISIRIFVYLAEIYKKYDYYFELANLAILNDELDKVEFFLKKALEIEKTKEAYFLLASLYFEKGRYDKLEILLEEIKKEFDGVCEDFIQFFRFFKECKADEHKLLENEVGALIYTGILLFYKNYKQAKFFLEKMNEKFFPKNIKSKVKNVKIKKMLKQLDNVVAFHTVGRGGSFFFHSLIDGHKEVATIPGVFLKGFFEPSVFATINSKLKKDMVYKFLDMYEVMFDWKSAKRVPGDPLSGKTNIADGSGLGNLGENRDKSIKIPKEKFVKRMLEYLNYFDLITKKDFFKILHIVWEEFRGDDIKNKKVIFYHIHNPTLYEFYNFLKWFKAKDLFIIRNWLQGLESWLYGEFPNFSKKEIIDFSYESRFEIFSKRYHNMLGKLNSRLFIGRGHIFLSYQPAAVKLEDVKNTPESTMRAVAKWMGIGYDESLLKPEFMGLKFHSNKSKLNPNISEFDKTSIKRKVGVLFSEKDALLLNRVLKPWNEVFEYGPGEIGYIEKEKAYMLNEEIMDWERELIDFFDIKEEDALKLIKYRKNTLKLALDTEDNIFDELKKVELIKPYNE